MISLKDLNLSIHRLPILKDVSFDIAQGQIFGLVGESGSGKSMTALALMQLLPQGFTASGQVTVDGTAVQLDTTKRYLMLNKPTGVVSTMSDERGRPDLREFVADIPERVYNVGRLDADTSGLLILTNDGTWSRLLTEPVMAIPKRYLITTESNIPANTAEIFHTGIYFAYEDITTHPAELEILSPKRAIVTIYEGKYHQIKRMFHAIGNRVTSLHRLSIGSITLDPTLAPGEYRALTEQELKL